MQETKPIEIIEPGEQLLGAVLMRLEEERTMRKMRNTFFAFSALFLASTTGLVYVIQALVVALKQSGFITFLSLLFTDTNVMLEHWQDFGYSLLESFPVLTIMATCSLLVVLIRSLQSMFNNSRGFLWTLKHIRHAA